MQLPILPATGVKNLLTEGNEKLGDVYHFSIPAGPTCPGKTAACAAACYATKAHFNYPNVKRKYEQTWQASLADDFVDRVSDEIERREAMVVRVHSSGDFYDAGYTLKWAEVARRHPETTFYAYTRSWRVPEIVPTLRRLARLKNFVLWFSTDREAGRPPRWKGVRVAYMQGDYGEPVPKWADLVFRVKHHRVEKYINGVNVCGAENGIQTLTGQRRITCEKCKLCFSRRPIPRKPA